MAMSGAQKQACYRERQKRKLLELVEEVARLRAMVGRARRPEGYREIVARPRAKSQGAGASAEPAIRSLR
jgi:hypothetical protein